LKITEKEVFLKAINRDNLEYLYILNYCKTSTNFRGPYECVDNTIYDQYGQKTGGGIDRSSPSTLRGDGNIITYEGAEEA
jgi:hypothetical protein